MTTIGPQKRTEPFLTIAEVARILAVSRRTIRRLIDARKLAAIRTGPAARAHLRIPTDALDRFVASAQAAVTAM